MTPITPCRPRRTARAVLAATATMLTVLGAASCTRPGGGGGTSTTVAPPSTPAPPTTPTTQGPGGGGGVTLPTPNNKVDYQLGRTADPARSGAQIVSRDHTASPAGNVYNICYVNAFQAQTDDEQMWLTQHGDLVLRDSAGRPVKDTDWNELILDISTPAKRTGLLGVIGTWIDECRSKGFKAVEFDNLDTYSRSGGRLTQEHAVAFQKLLSDRAHSLGLAAAQKNSGDLVGRKAQMGTDFAVVEECNRYSECDVFTRGYGNLVFIIEYRRADFTKGCGQYPQLSIVFRDVELNTVTQPGDMC
jgi:hypothetical protein